MGGSKVSISTVCKQLDQPVGTYYSNVSLPHVWKALPIIAKKEVFFRAIYFYPLIYDFNAKEWLFPSRHCEKLEGFNLNEV